MFAIEAAERREEAAYWRAGLITATLVNINRRKGARPVKPTDFVPRRRKRRPHSPERMAQALQAFTLAMGGEVIRGH